MRLVVTASEDAAGPRDRVTDDERVAVEEALTEGGVAYQYEPTLAAAVRRVLEDCSPDDLVLLLRAQGMDGAARLAHDHLDPFAP